ncbi:MAG: heat shock protein HspQ [Arenicellales bacterium]|jgi:heat shock protein HspQ
MQQAKWNIGQLVHHKLFGYRGVVYDVDPEFMLTDEWYENIARSRPPKDEPWYRVLVDNELQETYVAQQNLEPATDLSPITNPLLDACFSAFENGRYIRTRNS